MKRSPEGGDRVIKLKGLRTSQGMRQIDLAEKLGISIRTYQRIEYGEQMPNVRVAILLQKIFCREIEDILIDEQDDHGLTNGSGG